LKSFQARFVGHVYPG